MSKRPRDGRASDRPSEPDRPAAAKRAAAPDDLDLWRFTARSVTPLRKAKARVPEVGAPATAQPKPRPPAPTTPMPAPPPTGKSAPARQPKAAPSKVPPPLVAIERRTARRIARGLVEIDARIDLHGLRQIEAERRLRAFVLSARAKGLRTVLVITGKGVDRGTAKDDSERSERGVLRRSVPMWLEQPELRDCVAGIAPAHTRHGGDGALYIHLRKRR